MKKENAQNVRPPSFQPQKGRKREAAADGQNAAQPNEPKGAAQGAPANGGDQRAPRITGARMPARVKMQISEMRRIRRRS